MRRLASILALLLSFSAQAQLSNSQKQYIPAEQFLKNGGAENGIVGWAAYADAAGTIPVDCTGGSPNITWTKSTSSPLDGAASFLFTKASAANRQGQGVAAAFAIERSARGSLIHINGKLELVSGTYAEALQPTKSDVILYVYDVTNSRLIEPTSLNINPNTGSFESSFQASTSQSYRMCLHQSSTSTQNYVLKFDRMVVGRDQVAQGPVVSDWETFTPTGSWNTNVTYTGKYRRVGDSAEIDASWLLSGAPNATNLTIDFSSICTADTAKIPLATNSAVGVVRAVDSGTASYPGVVLLTSSTVAQMTRIIADTGTTGLDGALDDATPFAWNTGDYGNAVFTVPCAGWASNVQSSKTHANGRTHAARMSLNAAQNIPTSVVTEVDLDTCNSDTSGMCDIAGNRLRIVEAGIYTVCGSLGYAVGGTGIRYVQVLKNAALLILQSSPSSSNYGPTAAICDSAVKLEAGDLLTLTGLHDSAGAEAATNSPQYTWLSAKKNVDSVVALGESKVRARYKSAVGAALVAATQIDFDTKDYDSHNAVTTGGSWKFTAPRAGLVKVKVMGVIDGATAQALHLYKDGAQGAALAFTAATIGGGNGVLEGSASTEVIAGQTIDVRPGSTAANFSASGDTCYIEIEMQ